MSDNLSSAQRIRCMSRILHKHTGPELAVRRTLFQLGYHYSLHDRRLPGCPDIIFPSRSKLILVHGCFWHRHHCKKGRSMPSTREEFWRKKLDGNRIRDVKNRRKLRRLGWEVLTIWECQIKKKPGWVRCKIVTFLNEQ